MIMTKIEKGILAIRYESKDLKKGVNLQTIQKQTILFGICKDKPFWIWEVQEHKQTDIKTKGICCFNHIIGLPI